MTTGNLVVLLIFCTIWVFILTSAFVEMTRLRALGRVSLKREELIAQQRPAVEKGLEKLKDTDDDTIVQLATKKLANDMIEHRGRIESNVLMRGYYNRISIIIQRASASNNYEDYQEDIQTLKEFISIEEGEK